MKPLLPMLCLALLVACSSRPQADVAALPHFDGIYHLTYGNTGDTLYYRFLPDGSLRSARSDASPAEVQAALLAGTHEAITVNAGHWRIEQNALRVGVTEGSTDYDSRFDLHADGSIALYGLPRRFEFLGDDATGDREISTR